MNAQLKKELQRADIHAEFNLSWVHTRALIGVPLVPTRNDKVCYIS